MKSLTAFAFGIICVGISAAQQTPSADATLPAANETKGLVQGKVVQEPGGQGIPGVLVTLVNYSATTDERGHFKIEGMKLGYYYMVYVSRSGYVASGKTNREKWVKAGQDTKDIVLHMAAGGIGGRILDAEGHPMRNVLVEAVTAKSDGGAGRNWASSPNYPRIWKHEKPLHGKKPLFTRFLYLSGGFRVRAYHDTVCSLRGNF